MIGNWFNRRNKEVREPEEGGQIDLFRQMVELKLLETEQRIRARKMGRKIMDATVYNPTSELGKMLRAILWSGGDFNVSTFRDVNLVEALKQADGVAKRDTPFVERAKQFEQLGNNLIYEHANALSTLTSWCLLARQLLDGQPIVIPEGGCELNLSSDVLRQMSNLFADSMDLIGVETYVQVVKPTERKEENNDRTQD